MGNLRRRTGFRCLFAVVALLWAAPAQGAPAAVVRADSPAAYLDLAMPLAARKEFLALSPAERANSPVLPKLMRRLADSGYVAEALSLYEDARPLLAEGIRSETSFVAGKILWERREYGKAAEAFRRVSGKSVRASEAALCLARILAAGGNATAAAQALSGARDGGEKSLLAGEIEMLRRNPSGAVSAWAGAPAGSAAGFQARILSLSRAEGGRDAIPGLLAAVEDAASGFPERAAAREALTIALLGRKDYGGALSAAREALADAERWKAAAGSRPGLGGTDEDAAGSWRALAILFPYGEDAGKFAASGRRFLALAGLRETLRAAGSGGGEIARRVTAAGEGIAVRRNAVAARIRRAEEIRNTLRALSRTAEGMRNRLKAAADNLPLAEYGSRVDPRRAALLERIGRKRKEIEKRLAQVRGAANAAAEKERANLLPPEERRMVFYAQRRVARAEDRFHGLETAAALLRTKVWNRWKAAYVARLSVPIGNAEEAAAAVAARAALAENAILSLRAEYAELSTWASALALFDARISGNAAVLSRREAETRSAMAHALSDARKVLRASIDRREREMLYLAARTATDWSIADAAGPADDAALAEDRGEALRGEAIRYWEAVLSPAEARHRFADEALYALAGLRYEESASRLLAKEGVPGGLPDHSTSIAHLLRLVGEHPDSPYVEPAWYGVAQAFEETGAADNAAAAMRTLLARFPGSRFADEVHLRLGEFHFDRNEFRAAEQEYRRVRESAVPELRVAALFKLGWALFVQGRPKEAADPFLAALLLSPSAGKTGGLPQESLKMVARSLVEAGGEHSAEGLVARRGAAAYGPALLLRIQEILVLQNRYEDAAAVADRIGAAYPQAAERLDAELAASDALRKAKKDEESYSRRARLHGIVGPGSAWQASAARTAAERGRADAASEEGLRNAAFHFHGRSREDPSMDRRPILALYDTHASLFPSAPEAEETAYLRAFLLFEDGRKNEAGAAFEAVARRAAGTRGEASWYMAIQCAKDISSRDDAETQVEIVRLCREYERAFPKGERLFLVLLDRARAHFALRRFAEASGAAEVAAGLAAQTTDFRAAIRLAADARFEGEDFQGAEKAFRALLEASPGPEDAREAEKWAAFSMFRRAETVAQGRAAEAADLFSRVAAEFPSLDIAVTARFRAGTSYAEAGRNAEAIALLLLVETAGAGSDLSLDATRRLARLYETSGSPVPAAERYERLGTAAAASSPEKTGSLLRAAELFSRGSDGPGARRNLLAVASLPATPVDLRMQCLYGAAESARREGKAEEADKYYRATVEAQRSAPGASPGIAGKALFERAEFRFRKYATLRIAPPLEQTFAAKQESLEECAGLYGEAIRQADASTVSASLHRLGELFEDFRTAVLASPPPQGLTDREREEYAFLLEERAAPIEEKAVEAYRTNVRQAVAEGFTSPWVEKSLGRLKALRPARFGKKWEYAFPVLTVPDFRGIIERKLP